MIVLLFILHVNLSAGRKLDLLQLPGCRVEGIGLRGLVNPVAKQVVARFSFVLEIPPGIQVEGIIVGVLFGSGKAVITRLQTLVRRWISKGWVLVNEGIWTYFRVDNIAVFRPDLLQC